MWIWGAVIAAITALGGYNYVLELKLTAAESALAACVADGKTKDEIINNKTNTISTMQSSINDMAIVIDKVNGENAEYKKKNALAWKTLDAWRAKSSSAKFDNVNAVINPDNKDLVNATCADGKELNARIAELDYEKL